MIERMQQFWEIKFLSVREKKICKYAFASIFIVLFFDHLILMVASKIRFDALDAVMLFMTDFGLLFGILATAFFLLLKRKIRELFLILLTNGTALELSYLAKVIFQTPRPFVSDMVATIPLTQASGFSMPSLHAAFCFSVWPFLEKIFPQEKWRNIARIFIITIALSRLYLGVHYLSDIIAGAIIGYTIAKLWIAFQEQHRILEWFVIQVKDKFELRRQVGHLVTGLAIVFFIKLQLVNESILLLAVFMGGLLSFISRYYRIPFIAEILEYFERPEDLKRFPGKGSFYLVLGSYLTLKLFPFDIALAAITIMAVGDSITTIIGTYFGKIKNPLNRKKHLEGTFLAIIVATLGAFFFVDFKTAFIGSLAGMLVESITVRYISRFLDDNLFIPLIAGMAMLFLSK